MSQLFSEVPNQQAFQTSTIYERHNPDICWKFPLAGTRHQLPTKHRADGSKHKHKIRFWLETDAE